MRGIGRQLCRAEGELQLYRCRDTSARSQDYEVAWLVLVCIECCLAFLRPKSKVVRGALRSLEKVS